MDNDEKEMELIDLVNVIRKRKWHILVATFSLAIAATIISFILPPKWEIDALFLPSRFLVQTDQGEFREVLVVDPKEIVSQVNQQSYDRIVAKELNIDIMNFPKIKAENLKDTNLIRMIITENDTEKAKLILHSLLNHIKTELNKKVEIETKGIDFSIKSREIQISIIEKEISTYKNMFVTVKKRQEEIQKEMNDTRKRIEELDKEQRLSLKKVSRSETESLAMLLYSNEIQRSLMNHNTLNELLASKKSEEENINLEINTRQKRIELIQNEIINLNEKKGRIDYTQIIKDPSTSLHPVSPKKRAIILIAILLGFSMFTTLAFFLEYLENQKPKKQIKKEPSENHAKS
jgi:LPS O-antigen subunit length determinant protein (WzzB/FepE family)